MKLLQVPHVLLRVLRAEPQLIFVSVALRLALTAQAPTRWPLQVFYLLSPQGEDADAVFLALAGCCLSAREIGLVSLPPLFTSLSQRDWEGFLL